MPVADLGFTRDDIAVIERFAVIVLNRQRQVAESTGISGSFSKAFYDQLRELRMLDTRLEHKERSETLNQTKP